MEYDALIVASGKGQRANLGYNKVFYRMKDGKSVLAHSVDLFYRDEDCKRIIVVTNEDSFDLVERNEKVLLTKGGKERKDSVYNGLLKAKSEYVLIHDGARPFLNHEILQLLKKETEEKKAVVIGKYATDTIKIVENGKIERTIDRSRVFMAETPQAFQRELILSCYERCRDVFFTDDSSLAEALGYEVYALENPYDNRKLTREDDFRDL